MEQGKLRVLIHSSSKDKFIFRCPSFRTGHQSVAWFASKSGGSGAIQKEPASILPTSHSLFHKSYNLFEPSKLLLIASYWPVTRCSIGKRQNLPIHSQWAAGVSAKIRNWGPSCSFLKVRTRFYTIQNLTL